MLGAGTDRSAVDGPKALGRHEETMDQETAARREAAKPYARREAIAALAYALHGGSVTVAEVLEEARKVAVAQLDTLGAQLKRSEDRRRQLERQLDRRDAEIEQLHKLLHAERTR